MTQVKGAASRHRGKARGIAPAHRRPYVFGEGIPLVCIISDVCRALRISRPQFYHLRKSGTFPIPEIEPPIDARPRFRGEDVQNYVEGKALKRRPRRNGHVEG